MQLHLDWHLCWWLLSESNFFDLSLHVVHLGHLAILSCGFTQGFVSRDLACCFVVCLIKPCVMNKYPVPNTKSCVVDTYPFIYTDKLHIVNIIPWGNQQIWFPCLPRNPKGAWGPPPQCQLFPEGQTWHEPGHKIPDEFASSFVSAVLRLQALKTSTTPGPATGGCPNRCPVRWTLGSMVSKWL